MNKEYVVTISVESNSLRDKRPPVKAQAVISDDDFGSVGDAVRESIKAFEKQPTIQ